MTGTVFRSRLARHITAILVLKLIAILVLRFTLFGSHNRPSVDPEAAARHLLEPVRPAQAARP